MARSTFGTIAQELNISKQTASLIYKTGLNKVYEKLRTIDDISAFDALKSMVLAFEINNHDDFKQFYKHLSDAAKKEIEEDVEYKKMS